MLNYNKIESAINRDGIPKTRLARHLEIGESTLRSRLDRKNLTPDDVEKLADYFKKPISYFFDREENFVKENQFSYKINRFDCPECIVKQKKINELTEKLSILQEKYSSLLEQMIGKIK